MFRRRLQALDYHNWDTFKPEDKAQFRTLVSWLEDRKIRFYKIDEREALRDVNGKNWDRAFKKYLEDIECPIMQKSDTEKLCWLLGLAVAYEYGDNKEEYQKMNKEDLERRKGVNSGPQKVALSEYDQWDLQTNEFKAAVDEMADLLGVSKHPDHLVTFEACCKVISQHLDRTQLPKKDGKGKSTTLAVDFSQHNMGFSEKEFGGNKKVIEAAKILRLLFLTDLRDLQSQVNSIINRSQLITANPKTDTRLGKVGR